MSRTVGGRRAIILREGTFYLPETLQLSVLDSDLNIIAFPGEQVGELTLNSDACFGACVGGGTIWPLQ